MLIFFIFRLYFSQGKTSLAKALLDGKDAKIDKDQRTVGIDQHLWKPRPGIDDLEVLMIDCAGQRKYLLTHQFFFSQGRMYFII